MYSMIKYLFLLSLPIVFFRYLPFLSQDSSSWLFLW